MRPPAIRALFVAVAVVGVSGSVPLLIGVPAAQAATDVTSTADSGTGSLRSVVAAAGAGDTITFASGVTGTITLTTGPIGVDKI